MLMTVALPASRLTTTRRVSSGLRAIAEPRSWPVAAVVHAGIELLELPELLEPPSPVLLEPEVPASELALADVADVALALPLVPELEALFELLPVFEPLVVAEPLALLEPPSTAEPVLLPQPATAMATETPIPP
jgi:hypothetical protein